MGPRLTDSRRQVQLLELQATRPYAPSAGSATLAEAFIADIASSSHSIKSTLCELTLVKDLITAAGGDVTNASWLTDPASCALCSLDVLI